jgi:ribosomal protein S27E
MSQYKAILCPECHRHIILFEIKGTDYEARIKCRLCRNYFVVTPEGAKKEGESK